MSAWPSQANSQKQSDSGLDGPVGSSLESFFPDFGIEQSVFVQVLALKEQGSWAMASIRFPNCQEVFCPGMYGSCSKGLNPESPGGAISLQAQWQ